jgi:hypothetical protein
MLCGERILYGERILCVGWKVGLRIKGRSPLIID